MTELAHVSFDATGEEDVVVAHLTGEVDLSNAAKVGDELASAVPNRALGLVVDMTDTKYLDSSGVSLMFDLSERLRRRQQQLRLVVPEGASLRRVLRIIAAGDALPIAPTVDEASEQIRSA